MHRVEYFYIMITHESDESKSRDVNQYYSCYSLPQFTELFSLCANQALASNFIWAGQIGDEDVIYEGTSEPNKLHSVCEADFAFYIRYHLNSGRALARSWDCNLVSVQACPTVGHKTSPMQ